MKISVLPLLLAFLIINCVTIKSTPSECSKFRKGRYGFTKNKVGHLSNSKEVKLRVDSLETVIVTTEIADTKLKSLIGSEQTADTLTFKIFWMNDCSYERVFVSSSVRTINTLIASAPKVSGRYKIISFTDKYYIEQSIDETSRRDTFWIQ